MKVFFDLLIAVTITVGTVWLIGWIFSLPEKIVEWYYNNKYKPK
jgi:hypothetical protein